MKEKINMAGPVKKYSVPNVVAEARLKLPRIVMDFGEGREFSIDPPELWPDAVNDAASSGKATEVTKLLLGDRYVEFLEAGGSNSVLNLVLKEHSGGMAPGESPASDES